MPPRHALERLTIDELRKHAPFDEMKPEAMAFLASRLQVAYYPREAVIASPDSGVARRLYIVKQGLVRGSSMAAAGSAADVVLGAGEAFPISALIGRRATVYTYRAESDVFCWELDAKDFHALLERSPRFHAFCTDHLAALVARSHRAVQAEAGASLADAAAMLAPLSSVITRSPVSCGPGTPVREVLARMHAERIGSMVVVDGQGAPAGIFTASDVLGRVAVREAPLDAPIARFMTPDPVTLEEDGTLADAATAMARHGIRHVVVTLDGRLAGVVSERDLFALQRVSVGRTSERIHSARTLQALQGAAEDVRRLARSLLAQGVAAEQLTAMVSALNDAIAQRVIALALERHALAGRWCWLALGSEGRMEQTFVTDQDNALLYVFDDEPSEGEVKARKRAFLRFADEVNEGLAACGFPLCKGDIMARNPRWCLEASEWRALFDGWIRTPLPEALLAATIFFDFRPLAGESLLAGDLRASVLEQTRANAAFLRAMAENALRSEPPLGLLGKIAADAIDLKGGGAKPFVDGARVLALAQARPETGTAPRLRAVGEREAADAFHFIQGLRLRLGNEVRTEELSPIDRRLLKEAFRGAALLQSRLRLDYHL